MPMLNRVTIAKMIQPHIASYSGQAREMFLFQTAYSSGNISKNELVKDINVFIKDQTRTEAKFAYKSAGGIISAIIVAVFFVVLERFSPDNPPAL